MKRQKRGTFLLVGAAGILSVLLCGKTLQVRAQEGTREMAQEKILRYSEVCDTQEEIQKPEEYMNENGDRYLLKEWEIMDVPVTGRKKELKGQILYSGVGRWEDVPQAAVMDVMDEESGQAFEAELPLDRTEYCNERWQGDFLFTATFHSYGADAYRLGELEIQQTEHLFETETEKEELLRMIGMDREQCRIEHCQWKGESYEDEAGILCRDVLIEGERKVWDCTAVYAGMVKLPDYLRYRIRAEYRREEKAASEEKSEERKASAADLRNEQESSGETMAERWRRVMRTGIRISIGVFMIVAAVLAVRRLADWARKADEEE